MLFPLIIYETRFIFKFLQILENKSLFSYLLYPTINCFPKLTLIWVGSLRVCFEVGEGGHYLIPRLKLVRIMLET